MVIDPRTLESILDREASDLPILEPYLVPEEMPPDVPRVYEQDIVDAISYIKSRGLLEEGRTILSSYADLRSVTYELGMKNRWSEARPVPDLRVQLEKEDAAGYFPAHFLARLLVHWNEKDYNFAEFKLL